MKSLSIALAASLIGSRPPEVPCLTPPVLSPEKGIQSFTLTSTETESLGLYLKHCPPLFELIDQQNQALKLQIQLKVQIIEEQALIIEAKDTQIQITEEATDKTLEHIFIGIGIFGIGAIAGVVIGNI